MVNVKASERRFGCLRFCKRYDTLKFRVNNFPLENKKKKKNRKQRKDKKLENVVEYIFRVSKMIVKDIAMRPR